MCFGCVKKKFRGLWNQLFLEKVKFLKKFWGPKRSWFLGFFSRKSWLQSPLNFFSRIQSTCSRYLKGCPNIVLYAGKTIMIIRRTNRQKSHKKLKICEKKQKSRSFCFGPQNFFKNSIFSRKSWLQSPLIFFTHPRHIFWVSKRLLKHSSLRW